MGRVGVHARMPHRRYLELRNGKRELETLETCRDGVVACTCAAETRARHGRDQIRLSHNPYRIGVAGHDNHDGASKTELLQGAIDRLGDIAFP